MKTLIVLLACLLPVFGSVIKEIQNQTNFHVIEKVSEQNESKKLIVAEQLTWLKNVRSETENKKLSDKDNFKETIGNHSNSTTTLVEGLESKEKQIVGPHKTEVLVKPEVQTNLVSNFIEMEETIMEMNTETLSRLYDGGGEAKGKAKEEAGDESKISRMEVLDESCVEGELEEGSTASSGHTPWVLVGLGMGVGLLLLILLLLLLLLGICARRRWTAEMEINPKT